MSTAPTSSLVAAPGPELPLACDPDDSSSTQCGITPPLSTGYVTAGWLRVTSPAAARPRAAPLAAAGQVVHGPGPALGLRAILRFLQAIINFVVFFFKTILNPGSAEEYAQRSRKGGGGSGPGGGGPRPPPRGPRITGLGDLRDASGGELGGGVGRREGLALLVYAAGQKQGHLWEGRRGGVVMGWLGWVPLRVAGADPRA